MYQTVWTSTTTTRDNIGDDAVQNGPSLDNLMCFRYFGATIRLESCQWLDDSKIIAITAITIKFTSSISSSFFHFISCNSSKTERVLFHVLNILLDIKHNARSYAGNWSTCFRGCDMIKTILSGENGKHRARRHKIRKKTCKTRNGIEVSGGRLPPPREIVPLHPHGGSIMLSDGRQEMRNHV